MRPSENPHSVKFRAATAADSRDAFRPISEPRRALPGSAHGAPVSATGVVSRAATPVCTPADDACIREAASASRAASLTPAPDDTQASPPELEARLLFARLRVARMLAPPGDQRERIRDAAALARLAIDAIGSLGYVLITARV